MKALLSVYDKTGIEELARGLSELGWELVSSGGTARHLAEEGLEVTDLADLTGFPPMLGHRVVTLHPLIHGAILADPDDPEHRADLETYGIEPFALVVVNLYPFGSDPSAFAHTSGATAEDMIDIGGPAMTRAAAKNHAHVGIVVDPTDYEAVLEELRLDGALSAASRRAFARKAFAHTAAYDAAVVTWFDESAAAVEGGEGEVLPPTLHLALERVQDLRYGENPHQTGARYRTIGSSSWWDDVEQHQGLALSYLNLYDADAAWALVHDLGDGPAVAIIKHANPCGLAVADTLADAYQLAFECDERSAFGGIVALNRPVDLATAERMAAAAQADLVIAPGYDDGVLDVLRAKRKNTRVLSAPLPTRERLQLRQLNGGFLVQDAHHFATDRSEWRVVTQRQPTEAEWADAELAWRVCGWVKSNSIVLVHGGVAWGIGAGQQNRVEAGLIAAGKAAGRAKGGACASDAFYPFPDGIEAAAESGVAVIIQPGGAQRDADTIARADELGVAMVFTGERHFLH
jgi:phosphoribosylaminoimidazolecarboxamide formyltransferase/IMP cyclohydrolase